MNQHSLTDTSASPNIAPDAISRRAYELWESEGRPEGCDMRHWLQAEQELLNARTGQENRGTAVPSRNSDVTPLQGTRAAAAAQASSATRENKRGATNPAPVAGEKNGSGGQNARRKTSTPAL